MDFLAEMRELIMLIRVDNVYKALGNLHWYPLHFKWVWLMYSGMCCHILCPGDTWNHLQPLAWLKTLLLGSSRSPAAKKPEVQTVCRGSLLRIVKPTWPGAVISSSCLLPPLPLALCNVQGSAENPKQLVLLNTKGMNVVKGRKWIVTLDETTR